MADYIEDSLDMPLRKVIPIINDRILHQTTYFGVTAFKSPLDAWVYQEIIYETKPDVIIEIGNFGGGGTLFLAHLCDLIGKGRIIGLDISHEFLPDHIKKHPRIKFILGDACKMLEDVKKLISNDEKVLVIEDSLHTYGNTLNVLRAYSTLIKPGDYFIVEDSIIQHGLDQGTDPGPYKAIETFIHENKDFEIDRDREHFFITWNPKGYLKRISLNTSPSYTYYPPKSSLRLNKASILKIIKLFTPPILIYLIGKIRNLKRRRS